MRPARPFASPSARPLLPKYVRLHFDVRRGRYAVLAPERVYWPDEIALAILKLCDGDRAVSDIALRLAEEYAAPAGAIEADVMEFVQSWTDLRMLELAAT